MSGKRPRPTPPTELFNARVLLFGLTEAKSRVFCSIFACECLPRKGAGKDVSARRTLLLSCSKDSTLVVSVAKTRESSALALGLSLDELAWLIDGNGLRVVTETWVSRCLAALLDCVPARVALASVLPDGILPAPPAAPARPSLRFDTGGGGAGGAAAAAAASAPQHRPASLLPLFPQKLTETAAWATLLPASSASVPGGMFTPAPQLDASAWRPPLTAHHATRTASTHLVLNKFGYKCIVLPTQQELRALMAADGGGGCDGIRLLTVNIKSFRAMHEKCREGLARLLEHADIIALQETQETNANLRDKVRDLMQWYHDFCAFRGDVVPATATDFAVFSNGKCGSTQKHMHELGVAVLVRQHWAVHARVECLDLPIPHSDREASATASLLSPEVAARSITVRLPAAGLSVVCVHRPYSRRDARASTRAAACNAWPAALAQHVQQLQAAPDALPIAVMGDLNAHPTEAQPHHLWEALAPLALRDATDGTTELYEPSHFPATERYDYQRLDYLLLDAALQARLVRCSGRVLSVGAPDGDHVPVFAVLRAATPVP